MEMLMFWKKTAVLDFKKRIRPFSAPAPYSKKKRIDDGYPESIGPNLWGWGLIIPSVHQELSESD